MIDYSTLIKERNDLATALQFVIQNKGAKTRAKRKKLITNEILAAGSDEEVRAIVKARGFTI